MEGREGADEGLGSVGTVGLFAVSRWSSGLLLALSFPEPQGSTVPGAVAYLWAQRAKLRPIEPLRRTSYTPLVNCRVPLHVLYDEQTGGASATFMTLVNASNFPGITMGNLL